MRQRHYEEQRLFRDYRRTGSREDRDAIVERFLPLARSLARRQHRGGEPLEDLEQVAFLALVRAVESFDPSRGTAFSSFAMPSISGAIKRHYRDSAWAVRVPRELQELAMRVDRVNDELSSALGAVPTPAEIADHIGVTVEDVLDAREAHRALRADSLDRPGFSADDAGDALIDTIGSQDDGIRRVMERATLDALIDTLERRDQVVVRLYYEQELTQAQIGAQLGYSQMHISRLIRRATERLLIAATADEAGHRRPSAA